MHFVDRQAKYPNRWTMLKSDGSSEIVTLIRNDEPTVPGTPMNAETLNTLSDVAGADIAREEAEAAAKNALSSQNAAKASENGAESSASKAAESANKAAEIIKRMDNIKSGYYTAYDVSIPASAWDRNLWGALSVIGYGYKAVLTDPVINAALEPHVTVLPESTSAAKTAELACQCETGDKSVTFWAKNQPTNTIKLRLLLFGQGSSTGGDTSPTAVLGQAILGSMVLDNKNSDVSGASAQSLTEYQKQNFQNGSVLYAAQLNHMEEGIEAVALSDAEKSLLLSMLNHTIYDDALMQSIYDKLHTLWGVDPVEPTKPIVPVSAVELSSTTLNLRVGNTATLTATVSPSNATDKTVTWSISPNGFATVENGKVTTLKVGSCTVTATAGNVSATCTVSVIAEPSSTSVPGETPVYKLPAAKTFVVANQEYIDTGIKMFETIDPKPSWTILFEVQCGSNMENVNDTYVLMHCMDETPPWPGFTVQVISTGGIRVNLYKASHDIEYVPWVKTAKRRFAIRINGTELKTWSERYGATTKTISGYDTAVAKNLLLGCYQASDGTKGRYWDGTLYQCMVFHKSLTDEQVVTWLTT